MFHKFPNLGYFMSYLDKPVFKTGLQNQKRALLPFYFLALWVLEVIYHFCPQFPHP